MSDVHIQADFSPEAYDTLTRLSKQLNTTKADVLRRALGLMDFIVTESSGGWTVVLEKEEIRKEITSV